ncbi:FmdE family protein [Thermodesulforhabdus norvegica]|uniref:Formylmethanofuran dehydrogenase, subunit E n=1 Tax=Thermodesulforhabdus norvegica TaxID=39841 RepID=A0A1I4UN13_9BACT|nr:FmdE family protein [Thermodesulforhabdus norvegica]SFM90382.1 formylmethanofuran dehydrogenase, subunit E [Thermodesulforhabdus norvegica]
MDLPPDDFKKCVEFHGHVCPGLVMGYKATKAAMEWLEERRSEDEEIVAIVENDACFVDAVQVLSGCTFGKGNFIFCDYGKMAVTFLSRSTGKGIRVSLKGAVVPSSPEHRELFQKIQEGRATQEEHDRFRQLHEERSKLLMEKRPEDLFFLEEVSIPLPPKARIEPSEVCELCGEPTMRTKMVILESKRICRACAAREQGKSVYPCAK